MLKGLVADGNVFQLYCSFQESQENFMQSSSLSNLKKVAKWGENLQLTASYRQMGREQGPPFELKMTSLVYSHVENISFQGT